MGAAKPFMLQETLNM